MESGIRNAAVAGSFYPENRGELHKVLGEYFDQAEIQPDISNVRALIVPHAGYFYSGSTAAWGYKQISKIKFQISKSKNKAKPDFIIIGPTHNFYFAGIAGNDFTRWETPLGKIKHIPPAGGFPVLNRVFIPEHSVEVQLPFLQYLFKDFSVSCFLTGQEIDYRKDAETLINSYLTSIFVISSDLSHYLPQGEAEVKDKKTVNAILSGDTNYIVNENNVACGSSGISVLMTLAKMKKWKSRLIHYETSAHASGDTDRVVGYAAILFYE